MFAGNLHKIIIDSNLARQTKNAVKIWALSNYPNMQSSLLKDISVKNEFNNYSDLYYNEDIWLITSLKY